MVFAQFWDTFLHKIHLENIFSEFANYWLKNFSIEMLTKQLQVLKSKQEGQYIAPRVLQQILNYIETAIGHAHTWRILKNVYQEMLIVILFPLLCFRLYFKNITFYTLFQPSLKEDSNVKPVFYKLKKSDDDQDLWDDDHHEYIRSKFDVFEDFISPNTGISIFR